VKKLNGFELEEKAPSPKNGDRDLQTIETLGLKGMNGLGMSIFGKLNGGGVNGHNNGEHPGKSAQGEKVNGHTTILKAAELESRAANRKHQWGVASVDAWDDSTRVSKKVMEASQLQAQPRVKKRDNYDAQYDAGKKRHKAKQALGPAPGARVFEKAEAANAKWAADAAASRRKNQDAEL
jgi:hypothetical protein